MDSYTKEHSAEYQSQALIDLAFRMREQVGDTKKIERIVIHTSHHTHYVIGTGANDPQKMDPKASRETLDHSIMYIFAVALQDGRWHHVDSYAPLRARRKDTVELWHKIETREDEAWTRRYHSRDPNELAFGARVEITMKNGQVITDELAIANAHPLGATPWGRDDYIGKFNVMTEGLITAQGVRALPAGRAGAAGADRRRTGTAQRRHAERHADRRQARHFLSCLLPLPLRERAGVRGRRTTSRLAARLRTRSPSPKELHLRRHPMSDTTTTPKPKKSVALSGVLAGNTALCTVGRTGNDLHYRGYDILEIAETCEFEEIAHLLVHGTLPTAAQLHAYKAKLHALRGIPLCRAPGAGGAARRHASDGRDAHRRLRPRLHAAGARGPQRRRARRTSPTA